MLCLPTPDHYFSNISPSYQHIHDKAGGERMGDRRKDVEEGMLHQQQSQIIANQILFTAQLLDKLQLMPFATGQGTV